MEPQRVVYRLWPNGTVTALFPDQTEGPYVASYEWVGQHGLADYWLVISKTTPASPVDYDMLHDELLDRRGYNLRVVTRARPRRASVEALNPPPHNEEE